MKAALNEAVPQVHQPHGNKVDVNKNNCVPLQKH
jgi:hypothetical protein